MEEALEATFYQDDFLTRTLTTSVLYDKSGLDLNFVDNNNQSPQKYARSRENERENPESPNLDFLKLGSPDLEQMFLNIHENNDANFSNDDESVSAAAFNLEDDLINGENCFTDALQQLHDKQETISVDLSLIDVNIKSEKENNASIKVNERRNKQEHVSPPHTKVRNKHHVPMVPNRPVYNNNLVNNNLSHSQMMNKNVHRELNVIPTQQQQHHPQNVSGNVQNQHIPMPEQIALNNQMALMNSMSQSMNAHQIQQQQQEIAFLTQAMGYQLDRENIQPHMVNGGFPQHNNQIPTHVQQKIMEQQMMHQQINAGYPPNENNQQMGHIPQMDALAAMGVDEQTAKMLMENPHMAPINLEIQELVKRERKKLRNRIASSKCRKRKLEREGRLEDRVKDLKEKNIELNAVANALKQQICDLKQRVMDHVGEGCQIVLPT